MSVSLVGKVFRYFLIETEKEDLDFMQIQVELSSSTILLSFLLIQLFKLLI